MAVKGRLVGSEQGERRAGERRELRLETAATMGGGESANATIHNASTSGMLIETALPLGEGDRLMVELPESEPVGAQVVWRSGQLFGCRFAEPLSQAVLAASELRSETPLSLETGRFGGPGVSGLGSQLENLRKQRGMTLAQVASRLDVSKPTVWAWEKGKARPVPERLPAIADVLGVSLEELSIQPTAEGLEHLIADSRQRIADACGVPIHKVRVFIEV